MKNNYIKSERMWNVCLTYVYRMFYVISILFTLGIGQSWGKYIYLNLNSWTGWENKGDGVDPYFRVTFWKAGTSDTNYSLTSIGNHLYRADIGNESRTSMTFKRMKTNTETQWNYANMTIDGEKNVCVISGWDNSGAWGSYKISRVQGGYIYFDNSVTQWSGTIQFVIGHDDYGSGKYSRTYTMSQITGTQIWYVNLSDQSNHTWNDATYFAFIATDGKWEDKGWGSDNISNATNYTGIYSSPFDLNDGSTYMCTPSAAANGSSFSITYKSSGYSAIASTYTHNLYVYTRTQLDGSTPSYGTSLNSPTTVNIKGYQMTGNGASTQQTSSVTTSSNSTTRGSIISTSTVSSDYTALGANSAWTFDGWAVNTGGPSNTNSTYSITNAKAAKSIYAYFSKRTYTVSFNMHGYGDAVSDQVKDYYALVAQPSTPTTSSAYVFRGWWKESTYVNQWNFSSDHVTTTTTLHAKWLAYVNVAYNKGANGTGSNVTDKKVTGENLTLRGAIFTRTGYTQTGWSTTDGGAKAYNLSATYSTQSALNLYPFWTVNTYNITLNAGTGGSGSGSATVDYDATAYKTFSHNITQTGYHIEGWYDNGKKLKVLNDDGTFAGSSVSGYISSSKWCKASDCTLQAWWDPNDYTVTLDVDEDHQGTISGATTSHTVTYNTVTTDIPNLPTAENGYGLEGYYTDHNGAGTKLINGDGTWIASVDGYTDGSKNWIHDGDVTLYAYYKKAEITSLVLTPSTQAPGESVTATPTIYPTPVGDKMLCWKLLRANGNPMDPQPAEWAPGEGNAVSFDAPATSGSYKVACILRTGSSCSGGTVLDSVVADLVVAGEHTVTIQYQDGSGRTLKDTIHITARPLEWTTAGTITPPTITGYTFARWEAGDGISIKNGDSDPVTTTTTESIQIKAIYDGTLTAVYNKKRMIYFYNTLNWESVYVYFYKNDSYWESSGSKRGSGASTSSTWTDTPYSEGKHGQMQPVSEGSKIYYFDAEAAGVNASYDDVVFTEANQHGYEFFYATKAARRGDYKTSLPMYVPLADQTPAKWNSTDYYDKGYWMNYPENTGYTLKIYNSWTATKETAAVREYPFPFSEDQKMPLKLDVEFNSGGSEYWFMIYRNDGLYYGNTFTYNQNYNTDQVISSGNNKCKLVTSAPGVYTIKLTYHDDGANPKVYNYYIDVDFPVAVGDYRIVYKDNATWSNGAHNANWYHPSDVIVKKDGGATEDKKDIVSFYIAKGSSPSMKFQYASAISDGGAITWTDVSSGTINLSSYSSIITKAGVYNFHINQPTSGGIAVESVEPYTGTYYIRTDCAGNTKWDSYTTLDHQMTYSDYAAAGSDGFTHYYCHWVTAGTNVKFVIANDYSVCVSDTLEGDTYTAASLAANANIRFMYDERTNVIKRAYIAGSGDIRDRFLVLEGDAKMYDENGNALTGDNQDHDKYHYLGTDNQVVLHDDENFVYERTIMVNPQARAKLTAKYNSIVQYFKGSEGDFAVGTTIQLLGGDASATKYKMRIVYDFKTNRLVTAYIPGDEITGTVAINADVMLIREHQEAGQQLTFTDGDAKLTQVQTVYGVMRFNRWTLNNRANPEDHDKDHSRAATINTYHPLLGLGSQKSMYERALYWISFPFDVNLSDVFGFGTYGVHWIMMDYNGAERARIGYWKDNDEGFWEYIEDRRGVTLKAGRGYVLALELELMQATDTINFWYNQIQQVELFFPSTSSTTGTISQTDVNVTVDSHLCTIDRRTDKSTPDWNNDRRIADSHWNIIGVPSYANYGSTLTDAGEIVNWQTYSKTANLPFLYEWNANDNTYTAQSGSRYNFKAMHAYYVQYAGTLHWTLASATPSSIVARRTYAEEPENVEFRLELQQNDKMIDQTFVKMSNDEEVSANFAFGEDMDKEFNAGKANVYTFIEGYIPTAGNTLPMSDETTIVPVGVKITSAGEYTFAIPEGTEGIGVTLIDNVANTRTNLSALDYTVNLTAGTHDGRFLLEISPIHNAPTDIGEVTGDGLPANGARKVLIDGILYIVKGDKLYDVRGTMIK